MGRTNPSYLPVNGEDQSLPPPHEWGGALPNKKPLPGGCVPGRGKREASRRGGKHSDRDLLEWQFNLTTLSVGGLKSLGPPATNEPERNVSRGRVAISEGFVIK